MQRHLLLIRWQLRAQLRPWRWMQWRPLRVLQQALQGLSLVPLMRQLVRPMLLLVRPTLRLVRPTLRPVQLTLQLVRLRLRLPLTK